MAKQFRIPGLIKFESSCLKTLSLLHRGENFELLVQKISGYLKSVDIRLSEQGVSYHELTPRNEAALLTLKGIIEKHFQQNTRYSQIYKQCSQALSDSGKYNKSLLILRYNASSRLFHSIRKKHKTLILNISLVSLSIPNPYFYYLTRLLIRRLSRTKPHPNWLDSLRGYEIPFLIRRPANPKPVRKSDIKFQGQHFNLFQIFTSLNQKYFSNKLSDVNIGWSPRKNFRRLGSYNASKQLIRISKILDQPDIPAYVVRGIVYHEMLHTIHPIYQNKNRRIIHSPEFKRDEKKFNEHTALEKWLKNEFPKLIGTRKTFGGLKRIFY
jgi:hypothetical protein